MSLSNKPAMQVDTSPKLKRNFSVRDRTIAIMLAAAFLAVVLLGIGAFSVHDNSRVEAALAELEAQKKTQLEEYGKKLAELDAREAALGTRETDLTAREAALEQEKTDFYASQSRVHELSEALYLELTPTKDE